MQPLGNKILVKDIIEEKKSNSGLILDTIKDHYKKVEVVQVSPESQAKYLSDVGIEYPLKPGDICLADRGGVELEPGVWLCHESLLACKL